VDLLALRCLASNMTKTFNHEQIWIFSPPQNRITEVLEWT